MNWNKHPRFPRGLVLGLRVRMFKDDRSIVWRRKIGRWAKTDNLEPGEIPSRKTLTLGVEVFPDGLTGQNLRGAQIFLLRLWTALYDICTRQIHPYVVQCLTPIPSFNGDIPEVSPFRSRLDCEAWTCKIFLQTSGAGCARLLDGVGNHGLRFRLYHDNKRVVWVTYDQKISISLFFFKFFFYPY